MKRLFVISFVLFSSTTFAQGLFKEAHLLKPGIAGYSKVTLYKIRQEQPIPQNYYTQCFGFFCRQELKMQQAHIPITFRLGSMDYCNWLEQKPGYR